MKRFYPTLPLAFITLIALALRLFHLDLQPLWADEGYSMFFATRDFVTLLERTAIDIHPPLYYTLLQFWMLFAGKSDVAARLLSVVIGTTAIPLMYALASKFLGNFRVAFIAALVLTLSPLHIYYSQEVRMYGLITLLGMASVYLFVQLLEMPPGKPKTALVAGAYIVVTTAALYTQYYAVFIIAFQVSVFAILFFRRSPLATRHSLLHWSAAWFSIALLYLPWVIYAGPKLYSYVTSKVAIEKYPPLDPATYLAQHFAGFSVGHLTVLTDLAWACIITVILAIVGFWAMTRRHEDTETQIASPNHPITLSPSLLVALSLIVPLALGYLINLVYPFHPIHNERLLLLAAPAFYMLVASGINALWQRRTILGVTALLFVAILSAVSLADFYNVPRYPNDDYRSLIAEVQSVAHPADVFLAIYPWQIGYLEAYYRGAPLEIFETPNDSWIKNPARMQSDLDTLAQRARIWIPALQTQGHILEDALDANLRPRTYTVLDQWYGTTRLELFALANDPPLPRAPRNIVYAGNVTLGDVGVSMETVAAGQDIVRIRFHGEARDPASIRLSFRLLDQKANIWVQSDREMARDIQRIGLAIPAGTPPGEYELRVATYHAQDNSPLPLAKDSTQENALLATVHVTRPVQPILAAVPHRTQIDFSDGVRLVGYETAPSLRPGEPAGVVLFWQAARKPQQDFSVVLQALDARGNIFAETTALPARGIYLPTQWQAGELVRDPQTIMLRGDTPDGDYRLVAATVDPTTNRRSETHAIGTIRAQGRPHYFGSPTMQYPSDARFGDIAQLAGYDLSQDGRTVRLVLYWRALASTSTSYTIFVHALDGENTLRAQSDHIPGTGAFPTTSWVKDEYIADLHVIQIPVNAPPGEYQFAVGLYDATSGTRLAVFNSPTPDHSFLSTRIRIVR